MDGLRRRYLAGDLTLALALALAIALALTLTRALTLTLTLIRHLAGEGARALQSRGHPGR